MENNKKNKIEWKIARRKKYEHGIVFYTIFLLILAILLLISLLQKNILFGIFSILAVGTILFLLGQDAEIDHIIIDDNNITIENNLEYNFNEISHFDIYKYSDNDYVLLLALKIKFTPILQIRIYAKDYERIMDFLHKRLPRKRIEPSIIDIFQKIINL